MWHYYSIDSENLPSDWLFFFFFGLSHLCHLIAVIGLKHSIFLLSIYQHWKYALPGILWSKCSLMKSLVHFKGLENFVCNLVKLLLAFSSIFDFLSFLCSKGNESPKDSIQRSRQWCQRKASMLQKGLAWCMWFGRKVKSFLDWWTSLLITHLKWVWNFYSLTISGY